MHAIECSTNRGESMKTIAIASMWILVLMMSAGVASADKEAALATPLDQEVTGLFPRITSSENCDFTCPETYEIKCNQTARYLEIVVGDDFCGSSRCVDTYTQAVLIGLTPTSGGFYGQAQSTYGFTGPGDSYFLYLVRPGSEGTMKGVAAVTVVTYSGGYRDYAIDAFCYSNVYGYRSTSLVKKYDN
jgi:hypothetical protein